MDLLLDTKDVILIMLITIVGLIGGVVEFSLGRRESESIFEHTDRITPERLEQYKEVYGRLGSITLTLSGVPFLGPVVSITAGVLDLRLGKYVIWSIIGRLIISTLIVLGVFEGISFVGDLISGL